MNSKKKFTDRLVQYRPLNPPIFFYNSNIIIKHSIFYAQLFTVKKLKILFFGEFRGTYYTGLIENLFLEFISFCQIEP